MASRGAAEHGTGQEADLEPDEHPAEQVGDHQAVPAAADAAEVEIPAEAAVGAAAELAQAMLGAPGRDRGGQKPCEQGLRYAVAQLGEVSDEGQRRPRVARCPPTPQSR